MPITSPVDGADLLHAGGVVQLAKSLDVLPITRDYMADAEQSFRRLEEFQVP